MQHFLRFVLACGAVATVACDSTSPAPSGIGTSGGTASSSNNAAQVVIPAGALAANTVVTVTPASAPPATPGLVAGSAFEFGPSGTTFSAPVTITIKYDPATIPAGVAESSLQMYTVEGGAWTVVTGSSVNVVAHTISGATTHFSLYAPVGVVAVSTVSVTAPAATVTVGATAQLTAVTKDASGAVLTGRTITWSSSDAGRATVSATGLVTAVAPGAVTITATSEGKTGTVALTVAPVPVASVTVSPSTASINVGATATLAAVTKDAGGATLTGRTVTWTSSDATKATVSAAGVVTGVAAGSATITATSEGISATAVVTVSAVVAASVPVQLQAITTGDNHACGLNTTGAAFCWGYNGNSALGDGKGTDSYTPVAAVNGFTYSSIGAHLNLSCGITATATLYCWGGGSQLFNIGTPTEVASGLKFASVSVNSNHTCGVTTDGTGYCVGSNIGGTLGIGSAQPAASSTFLAVAGGLKWKQLSSTNNGACGITSEGALYCWGAVSNYNNGANAVANSNAPVLITSAIAFTSLTQRIGTTAVCGLTATGAAYCVGSNIAEFGAATGSSYQTPQRVGGTTTFKSLSYNSDNLCGVTTADALMCWGSNGYGQLGQGPSGPTASSTPVTVMSGTTFSAVDLSDEGSVCAVATSGKGYCWGYNFNGQVGDGTTANRSSPTSISGGIAFRVP